MSNSFYERPILNSPYEPPSLYHRLDDTGQPIEGEPIKGRRPSKFIVPVPASRKKATAAQASLDFETYIHPDLQAELDLLPKSQMTFLQTEYGKPFTPAGFTSWFCQKAADAGLPRRSSPHGLRKTAARWLAEAGCSAHQIAAITGHASLREVARYTASADQAVLAQAAITAIGKRL